MTRKGPDEDPQRGGDAQGRGPSLELDLDLRACATCRRELLPWQDRCPDDGGPAVRRQDLPPAADPLAERLAAELERDEGPDGP